MKNRRTTLAVIAVATLFSLVVLAGASFVRAGAAPDASTPPVKETGPVTVKGQVVCSSCWGEDDRTVTPYGTPEDIKCAASCNRNGVPPGLAVKEGSGFTLYILKEGKYAPGSEGWVKQMGKYIEAQGMVGEAAGKKSLKVDVIKSISASDAGFAAKAAG